MKRKKRIGTAAKAVGCAVLLMISLFPIYWLLAMAIRPTDEMRGHIALIPQSLTGMHFAQLFTSENFGQAIMNSLQTTFGSLIISLLAGICAAYVIARRRFRFGLKKPMTYWVLLVRVLPPVAFTIPLYIMFNRLGVLNTKLPVMLACVLINVPLIIWFLISFFQDLPEEIEESAKVDGATEWQLFRKIVLPWRPASRRSPCSASCMPGTNTPTPLSLPASRPTTPFPSRSPCSTPRITSRTSVSSRLAASSRSSRSPCLSSLRRTT